MYGGFREEKIVNKKNYKSQEGATERELFM